MSNNNHGKEAADRRRGITLVLGGGGARGLAHFGVFRVLQAANIPIHTLVGNSAGALAAAALLQSPDAEAAEQKVLEFLESPRFQRHKLDFHLTRESEDHPPPTVVSRLLSGWRRQVAMHLLFRRASLFHSTRLQAVLDAVIEESQIEELRIPLKVVALDISSGEETVLEQGSLRKALLASCSVAGFFPPVEIDGRKLIDAGQSDNLPVQVGLQCGRRPVVAVNLSNDLEVRDDFETGIEAMFRSEEIGSRWNTRLRAREADVHIAPALSGRYWLDFSQPEQLVRAGEQAAREALPRIRAVLRRRVRRATRRDPSARSPA